MQRVALVGRPNVGKSTLFNRLLGEQRAIVSPIPGVTRDRNYGTVEWCGREFMLIDTGGIDFGKDDSLVDMIRRQSDLATSEADLIVWLVDAREGLLPADREVVAFLRRSGKPLLLAVNKIDGRSEEAVYEFHELGIERMFPIAASHGTGTGDLLDAILDRLPPESAPAPFAGISIAIVGRPNVGKSSLVNALTNDERCIVSSIPGTTRDSLDTDITWQGRALRLIDTAGLRRRSRITDDIEFYSVLRAQRVLERCDVAVFLLDATVPLSEQDLRVGGLIQERGCGCVIAVNKWDAIEKDTHTVDEWRRALRGKMKFLAYAPIEYISAKTGQRINKTLESAVAIAADSVAKIATAQLNRLLLDARVEHPPPSKKGKRANLHYLTQTSTTPPTFLLFVNRPDLLPTTYRRYLKNRLRDAYQFQGYPIRLMVRKK